MVHVVTVYYTFISGVSGYSCIDGKYYDVIITSCVIISPTSRVSPSGAAPIVKNSTIVTMPTIDTTMTPNMRAVNPQTCLEDQAMMSL